MNSERVGTIGGAWSAALALLAVLYITGDIDYANIIGAALGVTIWNLFLDAYFLRKED